MSSQTPSPGAPFPPPDPSSIRADPRRVRAVHSTELLDTPPEEVFDRMTRLAAKILDVPASFISLVDEERDFYKSSVGFPEPLASERQLMGTTFCHYTLQSEQPLVLDDVTALAVFRDVPTVESLGVRAYLGVPIQTPDGHNVGSFCAIDVRPRKWSARDIETLTELAHSATREIDLRAAVRLSEGRNAALLSTDRRKDVFVATMAHELRQPLGAIVAAVAIVKAHMSPESEGRAMAVIGRQAGQLQRIVDDLMDVASVAEGKIALRRERVDLREILENIATGARPVIDAKAQVLSLAMPESAVFADVDAGRFAQVISNLLSNASKYTPREGEIRLTLSASVETATIRVRDNGSGIEAEALPHVFDLFMQEDTDQRAGLGIGLKVVRGIVELHGGTVEASSEGRDRGSEFVVVLPLSGTALQPG